MDIKIVINETGCAAIYQNHTIYNGSKIRWVITNG